MTSFPSAQLDDLIDGFSAPFRFDRNSNREWAFNVYM